MDTRTDSPAVEGGYQISPQQERSWRLSAHGPRAAGLTLALTGALDAERLRAALASVVHRHEILRTGLRRAPHLAMPVGVVAAPEPVVLERHRTEEWRPLVARLRERGAAEQGCRFDLIDLGGDRHLLVWTVAPHLLDAASAAALCAEVAAAYRGDDPGAEPLQYADFAGWSRDLLDEPEAVDGARYWRDAALDGPLPPFRRDTDGHTRRRTRIPVDTAALAVSGLVRDLGLRTVLLTSWLHLLARVCGGSPATALTLDGRDLEELAGAIGPYSRAVPVAASIEDTATFAALAAQVARTVEAHAGWQEFAPAWIREGEPAPAPTGLDLAEADTAVEADGVTMAVVERDLAGERAELLLVADRFADGLELHLEHDTGRYDAADADYLAEQYGALLAAAAADPDRPPAALPAMSAPQRRALVADFNRTEEPTPATTLHGLIEAAADAHPDRTAVLDRAGATTYAALDLRADQVAHWLRDAADPGAPVALCLDRGADAAIAMAGVLKAGCAYVPLDPGQPRARLAELIALTGAVAVITAADHLPRLPAHDRTLVLDRAGDLPGGRLDLPVSGDDLAYTVFTSGSTGVPKGVMTEHAAAVNTVLDVNRHSGIGPGDRIVTVSPLGFDLSVYDWFGTFAAGGTVIVPDTEDSRDPAAWADLVRRHGATVWNSVPALFDALVAHAERDAPGALASLRVAMLSGDWIPIGLPDRARGLVPGLAVVSMGGATEGAIWSIRHPVGVVDRSRSSIPYGRPMANQRFHVLDSGMEPCPVWTTGELAIGGAGVARGYFAQPGLTAERFVPDPFGAPGERLYRTGDLGRHRPGGDLEILGRMDDQVKLRGFRVEPAEVAARLLEHPAVLEAAAAVHADGAAPLLVAYAVLAEDPGDVDGATLRAHLAERLPEYMVPNAVMAIERLPLTPNGKVDLKALPAPDAASRPHVPPRDEVEEQIAALWVELLGAGPVGALDDFFERGGHSLLLAQLGSRIQERFGVEVGLQDLFEAATVEAMARLVTEAELDAMDPEEAAALLAESAAHDAVNDDEGARS